MDLKELERLVKLCRKLGVLRVKTAQVELELGDAPSPTHKRQEAPINDSRGLISDSGNEQAEELTYEQLLNWSVGSSGQDQ